MAAIGIPSLSSHPMNTWHYKINIQITWKSNVIELWQQGYHLIITIPENICLYFYKECWHWTTAHQPNGCSVCPPHCFTKWHFPSTAKIRFFLFARTLQWLSLSSGVFLKPQWVYDSPEDLVKVKILVGWVGFCMSNKFPGVLPAALPLSALWAAKVYRMPT